MRRKLKEIAVIRAGYQFRGRVEDDPAGAVRVIQIRDFGDDKALRAETLARVSLPRNTSTFTVERGDLLFLSRGHKLWASSIDTDLQDTIASGYFFVVKPAKGVLASYLAWYMRQEPFQASLRPIHKGSYIPLVSRVDFEELEVEVPSLAVQERIVALDVLGRREQQLLASIAAKRAQIVASVCMRAALRGKSRGN